MSEASHVGQYYSSPQELIRNRVHEGSIMAFNELTMEQFPGETIAVLQGLRISDYDIVRDLIVPYQSYLVVR